LLCLYVALVVALLLLVSFALIPACTDHDP
jgi:hypothetical protein